MVSFCTRARPAKPVEPPNRDTSMQM
uniref:Uncharacterized protein n=1 Tax=Arundo donax TaxID=35708 RepID=A0A0A8Y065_ARUDO